MAIVHKEAQIDILIDHIVYSGADGERVATGCDLRLSLVYTMVHGDSVTIGYIDFKLEVIIKTKRFTAFKLNKFDLQSLDRIAGARVMVVDFVSMS
jgi:hypothetical protein